MSATADIETDAAENAVLIPVAALFFQPIVEDKSESGKRPALACRVHQEEDHEQPEK